MKSNLLIALAIGSLAACTAFASAGVDAASIKKSLGSVSAAELPAQAASLVKAAKSADRSAVTVTVVKTCLTIRSASAPTIVGAIGKAAPDMVSTAAATAAAQQPKRAAEIASAAAAAVPTKAGSIVTAVCRAVPSQYKSIAVAVAQVVPGASKEILNAVAAALPELKSGIDSALAQYGANVPSVAAVLDSPTLVAQANNSPALNPAPRGPTIAPPYVPLSGTPGNTTPANSTPVPVGGRNYAAP